MSQEQEEIKYCPECDYPLVIVAGIEKCNSCGRIEL